MSNVHYRVLCQCVLVIHDDGYLLMCGISYLPRDEQLFLLVIRWCSGWGSQIPHRSLQSTEMHPPFASENKQKHVNTVRFALCDYNETSMRLNRPQCTVLMSLQSSLPSLTLITVDSFHLHWCNWVNLMETFQLHISPQNQKKKRNCILHN